MPTCTDCKAEVPENATTCPKCGKRVFTGDELENVPKKTSVGQKVIIAVSILLLLAIAFTFENAEEREDRAAQNNFTQPVATIVQGLAAKTGLDKFYGTPTYVLKALTKTAEVNVKFPRGTLTQQQAALFGQSVCANIARAYVKKGYMPRFISVLVTSDKPDGGRTVYGEAVYNGNIDALGWEPAAKK